MPLSKKFFSERNEIFMQLSKMKNIIVLKGMSSNVVDEAIVVLKPNVKIKQSEYNTKQKISDEEKAKKLIVVKEAEHTINTYVEKLQSKHKNKEQESFQKKYQFLQIMNGVLILIIVISAIIIA